MAERTEAEITVNVSNKVRVDLTEDTVLVPTNIIGLAFKPTIGRVEILFFFGKEKVLFFFGYIFISKMISACLRFIG